MSRFSEIASDAPIEVFALYKQFIEDTHPNKVNLGIGTYKDGKGNPWVLPVVRKVEMKLANDVSLDHEYLPIFGLDDFSKAAVKLVLGPDSPALVNNLAFGIQSLSGTGAHKIGFDFLFRNGYKNLYVSNPSWSNHTLMGNIIGFNVKTYRYYDANRKSIDFEAIKQDLERAPESNTIVVFQVCAHSPTGMDLSTEQWQILSEIVKRKKLFPFFDAAYQGFCSGDLDKDASAVRLFVKEGHELFVAQSFAKNMGLYNERIGNLTVVVKSSEVIPHMKSKLQTGVITTYSNPPAHGARIAAAILNEKPLNDEWRENLKTMSNRMNSMRKLLHEKLTSLSTPGNWDHILESVGLFCLTGLNERQCVYLVEHYHIYVLKNGRMNISALTEFNVDYVANAIFDAVTNVKGFDDDSDVKYIVFNTSIKNILSHVFKVASKLILWG